MYYPATYNLYHALKAEGYELPEECGDIQLEMPVDGVMKLHFTVLVSNEILAKVSRALLRLAEADKKKE